MMATTANQILGAYHRSQRMEYLFEICSFQSSLPLIFQDSVSPVPNHPFCAMGVLNAKAAWGNKKGIAFVVHDNYLLTCASNCYSHQHGEYTSITFTINSNRKSVFDTHKVSKVIIPNQYQSLSKTNKNQYNYALLYIDSEPNMSDKYGKVGIQFQATSNIPITYLECTTNDNKLLFIKEHIFQQNLPMLSSGGPLLIQDYRGRKAAVGLIFSEDQSSKPSFMKFGKPMKNQLLCQERLKIQKGFYMLFQDDLVFGVE